MKPKATGLEKNYVVLSPKGQSEIWTSDEFWKMAFNAKHPKNTKSMGYLVSSYEFDQDWNSWENHPNGDELVYCLSGKMTFVLEVKGGTESVSLKAGECFVVPKNTWHTARISKPSRALFMTWGFGTKHKPCDKETVQSFDYSSLGSEFSELPKPAQRALINNGIKTPKALAKWDLDDVMTLHGIGPSSKPVLRRIQLKARKA